ncbi:MAG: cytochrome d ubiquinol oxidase subunit II [candidate division KSB1 bacterium]|nr:cytochrome d ubiquinol oxidase subunit II [candidate division KSB1 bacterium]MDZ7304445.1 cytochrome d ubiquinol oxidase subunit II [candidate division KSB1 bacterium]MDZ7310938.1 cytochrome d ubiquinol oxidase subunit II [candidate division KSB1 bacterium]
METFWFIAVSFMLTMYVILDGFDLGAGIIHLFAGKSDNDRRTILNAIGPVWDGNEVWLIAAGGTMYFAFPKLYASSFSGFYLPLIIVLWLLMLRAIGIEFRHRIHHPMWKSFWDVVFAGASILLTIFFGAALGNVVRGVPLSAEGYFFAPLWTTFTVVPNAGILDWFTVLMGLVAFTTLTAHGGNYIAMKADGELQKRSRAVARSAWWGVLLMSTLALMAISSIRPAIWDNYLRQPLGFVFPLIGLSGWLGGVYHHAKKQDTRAFLSSSAFIAGMAASTAFGLFPNVLPASTDPQFSLTVYNTAAREYGLGVGLVWWIIGMTMALGYFTYVFYAFRGKIKLPAEGEGY